MLITPEELEALRRGDPAAFRALVERHATGLKNFIMATIRDEHAAEDLTQEVLASVVRSIGSYERGGSFVGWLYRMARNAALNYRRGRRRAVEREATAVRENVASPIEEIERRELHALVRRALETLDDSDRDVLVLCDMNGMSYREAADVLGVSEKALSVRLVRARNRLKEAVKSWR